MSAEQGLVHKAFKGPATSVTCAELGALFAKDNSGYDIETIVKKLKSDEASVWLAISRLRHEFPILESFVDYEKKIKVDGKVRVYNKFRVKKEFVPHAGVAVRHQPFHTTYIPNLLEFRDGIEQKLMTCRTAILISGSGQNPPGLSN